MGGTVGSKRECKGGLCKPKPGCGGTCLMGCYVPVRNRCYNSKTTRNPYYRAKPYGCGRAGGQYCGDEPPSYLIKSEEEIGESSGMSEGMIGESLDSSELPDSEMDEPDIEMMQIVNEDEELSTDSIDKLEKGHAGNLERELASMQAATMRLEEQVAAIKSNVLYTRPKKFQSKRNNLL